MIVQLYNITTFLILQYYIHFLMEQIQGVDTAKQIIWNRYNQVSNPQLFNIYNNDYALKKIEHCLIIYDILKTRLGNNLPIDIFKKTEELKGIKESINKCFSNFKEAKQGGKVEQFGKNTVTAKIVNKSEIIMLLEGELDINFFKLATMIYDVGSYNDWFPFVKQSTDTLNIGLAEKIVFLKIEVPFLSAREGYFIGQAFNRIQTDNIMNVYCSSVTADKQVQEKYKIKLQINEKAVVLDLKYTTAQLKMKKPNIFDFKMYLHVDINIQIIPEFVLGFVSKKFGEILFNKMITRANSIDIKQFQSKLLEKTLNFSHWLDITNKEWQRYYQEKQNPQKNKPKIQLSNQIVSQTHNMNLNQQLNSQYHPNQVQQYTNIQYQPTSIHYQKK